MPGPKKRSFPGLKVLAMFSAKPCRPWPPGPRPAGSTNSLALTVLRDFLEFLAVEQLIPLLLLWDQEASHNKYVCLNNHSFSKAGVIMMT